ncbi:MAG: hypothetical protein AAF628_34795 [Planctomycetota bacterium]
MNTLRRNVLRAFSLCLLPCALAAADLKLDGRPSVRKLMGDSLTIQVSGGASLPVTLFLDVSAGPITFRGQTLPLGFTPALQALPLGLTDASGNLSVTLSLPASPLLRGGQLFFMAVIADPMAPFGVDVSNGADLTLLDRNVDLAGHTLAQFPFFDHITAVNQGSTVEMAIDPTRYPLIVGQSADVYIVASKTRDEWLADPSLTDARGAPTPVTFGGSTIQANTFTLDAGTLAGSFRTADLGRPYDIVVDFNTDGNFDLGSDLADGFSDDEAGFYIVHNLDRPGPYTATSVLYNIGGRPFRNQKAYYPTTISTLGLQPLVVISHGNGHNYQWYDHLGNHFASYGYVVMSHDNNTQPGSHTAAITTQENTDAFLGALGTIASGAMAGHVDANKIVWIGHSRGGDGVVRAYDNIVDGRYVPANYAQSSIVLISSMAPVDFGGSASSKPHSVNYHVWMGQADEDVSGCAQFPTAQPYKLHDRADGTRMITSLYGVGHADFHAAAAFPFAAGPCLLGKEAAHWMIRSHFIALLEHFVEGNPAAKDYLWRQYDTFRPKAVPFVACVDANLVYQEGPARGTLIVDNFQTNHDRALASSGATVTSTVLDYVEGHLDDRNRNFTNNPNDPFNGFVMDASSETGTGTTYAGDDSWGCVFSVDGAGDYDHVYTLTAAQRDVRDYEFLQFRAAQGTRHPFTIAELGDVTFSVALTDGNGNVGTINIGAYGGGVEEPYQRNILCGPAVCGYTRTCGVGTGWTSDFETIRLRLGDFQNNGTDVDLADVRQIAFRFGPSWGSAQARLGLDEIEFARR